MNVAFPPKLIWVNNLQHRLTVHASMLQNSMVHQKVALVHPYMHGFV
jgi:hypothetical protein